MNLLEIGCGENPVAWQGEPSKYIGIDPQLGKTPIRKKAQARLKDNPLIGEFGLIPTAFHYGGFDEPLKNPGKRPDEVIMIDVLSHKEGITQRLALVTRALNHLNGFGKLVVIESNYAHHAELPRVATAISNTRSIAFVPSIFRPEQPEFEEVWDLHMARKPSESSRILVIE